MFNALIKQCSLTPLSNDFLPKVNGNSVRERSPLNSGDKISMGGRLFVFKGPDRKPELSNSGRVIGKSSGEEEFGRLVQLKHSGEDGMVVRIHGEILIGSRPPGQHTHPVLPRLETARQDHHRQQEKRKRILYMLHLLKANIAYCCSVCCSTHLPCSPPR